CYNLLACTHKFLIAVSAVDAQHRDAPDIPLLAVERHAVLRSWQHLGERNSTELGVLSVCLPLIHLHAKPPAWPRCGQLAGIEPGKIEAAALRGTDPLRQRRSLSMRLHSDVVHKIATQCARRGA